MAGIFDQYVGETIDLNYITHEAMIEASSFWELEEYQIENGNYRGYLTIVHTSNIQFSYTYRSHGAIIKGKTPQGCYVLAYTSAHAPITHNGISLTATELLVLDEDDEIDFTSSHESSDLCMVIEKEFFNLEFERYFNKPFTWDKVNKRLELKHDSVYELRTVGKDMLTHLMNYAEKLKSDSLFHAKAQQDILQTLFQSLDIDKKREATVDSDVDANKLRIYLEEHFKEDVNIQKVCTELKICERTARNTFKRLFGFTPKHFLLLYRLGKVHHVLLKTENLQRTVEHIAYDHGFTHMGRFSQQYQDMYGKKPSHTLKVESV